MKLVDKKLIWNKGYVEMYDMTQHKINSEIIRDDICEIAKVCRNIKEVKDKDALTARLINEACGTGSAILEFIPLRAENGEFTNFRAWLNGDFEVIEASAEGFITFKIKIPMMIVPHFLRHRSFSFNQRSNRMTPNTDYFYCSDFDGIPSLDVDDFDNVTDDWDKQCYMYSQWDWDFYRKSYKIRQELTNKGSFGLSYTELYIGGWIQDENTWKHLFNVRIDDKGSQKEMVEVCKVMRDMIKENYPALYEEFVENLDGEKRRGNEL